MDSHDTRNARRGKGRDRDNTPPPPMTAEELATRLLPQSLEAERSVLGSMLRDNLVISDVQQIISRKEDFYADAHQKLWDAIIALNDKGGQPVDVVLLAEELQQRKQIEDIGGYPYLAQLWDAAPTAANAEYYAHIVRDRAVVRNLIHASTEILRDAYDQTMPANDLLQTAERKILEVYERGVTGQTHTLGDVIGEAYDRLDRRASGQELAFSGLSTGFADLNELTAGFHASELIILAARPSVGKCLTADSEILLEDGSVVTIEELYRRGQARLLTLGADYQFRWTEPSGYLDDGVKSVYRVTTRLGRSIETTASHPFLTATGWRPLAELRPGDKVAVPRELPVFGSTEMRTCEVKLLAYLIGDGGLTDTAPEFTNSNPLVRQDFADAIADFGGVKVRLDDGHGIPTPTLLVATDLEAIEFHRHAFAARLRHLSQERGGADRRLAEQLGVSPALVCSWRQGNCVPDEETFSRLCAVLGVEANELAPDGWAAMRKNNRNALTRWLDELGLWGKSAHSKTIPACVYGLPRKALALFLNRLFATDGWASLPEGGRGEVGYATVCERLARQVQHLLLRFGVIARLRRRAMHYQGTRRISWQLQITGQRSIRRFASEIGIFSKEQALERVVASVAGRREQSNCDLVPIEVRDQLDAIRTGSWSQLAVAAGYPPGTNLHVERRAPSRNRLKRLACALHDVPLQQLAQSAVYWDEIRSIEPQGQKQVYDLTIPETHNFVANDVCVHNTAFALNVARHATIEEKEPIFFVSLEMSRIELAERMLCSQARVDSHRLRKGTLTAEDMEKLIEAGHILRNARLFIDDSPAQTMLRIAANARRLKHRHGIKMVVIDYLQLIEPDNRRDPRQEQVAQISRRLKFLAKELEIPVMALAQVNRASEDRQDHRPRLSDLRESGSIEQDADTVLMLHRPDRYEPGQHEGIIEVIVAKNRSGPVGEVTLAYIKQFMRYEDFNVGTPFDG
jgi:replicative DNA helicase